MNGPSFPSAFKAIVSLVTPSAQGVAERWRSQYHSKDGWCRVARGSSQDIYDRIMDLGDAPDPEKVAEIIGNKSWTHPVCDVTSGYLEVAVRFSREFEGPVTLAPDLIGEAARLLAERSKAGGE